MSRQLNHVFASMIGDVVTRPTQSVVPGQATTTVSLQIHSTMREGIFWRNALGILVFEPPAAQVVGEEMLYITVRYEFHTGVKIDARELWNELDLPENHVERKGIYNALQALERSPMWEHQRSFSYTLGVSREKLERAGGVAYLSDVDLVVGFQRHQECVLHPFSPRGQLQALSDEAPHEVGVHQQYRLVDNAGVYGPRWINTGYAVYELKPIHDPRLSDGLYVTTRAQGNSPESHFYAFTDAEKALGLYVSRAEAETFGSPEEVFKAGLKEQERLLQQEKFHLQRERNDLDRDKTHRDHYYREEEDRRKREQAELDAALKAHQAEMDRQRERMELERDRLEFDRKLFADRQKFDHELTSRDRKDRSDALKGAMEIGKAVVGLLSVGLSAYMLIMKNQKT